MGTEQRGWDRHDTAPAIRLRSSARHPRSIRKLPPVGSDTIFSPVPELIARGLRIHRVRTDAPGREFLLFRFNFLSPDLAGIVAAYADAIDCHD